MHRSRIFSVCWPGLCLVGAVADAWGAEADYGSLVLEEVIVTAEKRGAENLQDLAMSAAVISSELIENRHLVGMENYLVGPRGEPKPAELMQVSVTYPGRG